MNLLLSSPTTSRGRSARIMAASQWLLVAALAVVATTLLPIPTVRAELADDYLAGLRARGWHDTALEYLEQADDDPLASSDFAAKLDYERAVTEAVLANRASSDKQRQQLILAAADRFQKFADDQPKSPQKIEALAAAGKLLGDQALLSLNKADKLPKDAKSQREKLNNNARKLLNQAQKTLQKLLTTCQAEIKTLPKAAAIQKDPAARARQQLLLGKLAQAQFELAKINFEEARTYKLKSKERGKAFKTAAKAFNQLYKDYDRKFVGFYGRFYEGRSYQEDGKIEKALKCYFDIIDEPAIPNNDFRRLVSRTFRHRAECLLANDDFEKVIEECTGWINESRGTELDQPDWLALSYLLATAYDMQAASLKGTDANRATKAGLKLYRTIAKNPGEFQRAAKAKIASSGGSSDEPVIVKDFDEAFAAGQDALEQMNFTKTTARLAKENNPDAVDTLTEQAASFQTAATQYFLQATQFADEQTDPNELGTVRYYLCWLLWEEGHLHDAAVVGEYMARRNPQNKFAPTAAKLALASYERMYNAAQQAGEPTEFAVKHLGEVAELLATRWPESPEAATALNLLINIALRNNEIAKAEEMLKGLPPASRATAELRLGGALWTRYLKSQSNKVADAKELSTLKQKAKQLLSSGYAAIQSKTEVTASEAAGVLYFAQLLLSEGDAHQAIAALENKQVGPLSLVQAKAEAASRTPFIQETYKLALRAYISSQPPQREKSQAMMTALESAIGNQENAQQKLINIYVSLGVQLQQQIKDLTANRETKKAKAVAAAFADLLARVTERSGSTDDWKVQNWIARTNLQLGQGLSGKDATRYYELAEQAFQNLLDKAAKNPKLAPSPLALLATQKSLADCLQAQGKFSQAFETYTTVLKTKPKMLELQQAAATALQQWGTLDKNAKRLDESIRGALPQANRKKLVWGWLRLAAIAEQAKRNAAKKVDTNPKLAAKVAKYEDLFFEARYHVAEARFAAAKLTNGAKRSKQLRSAKQSIKSMQQLYPELGGPQWKQAYLKLLQEMEQVK